MNDFHVTFFDGQSSVGNNARLEFKQKEILIHYSEGAKSSTWEISGIVAIDQLGTRQVLRYYSSPQQLIECSEIDLAGLLRKHYAHVKFPKHNDSNSKSWKWLTVAACTLVALVAIIYFYLLPPLASAVAGVIPRQLEIDFGTSMMNGFLAGSEKDEEVSQLVNQFSTKIDFNTDYPIEVVVVKNREVNAFALPGGKIVIFDGILRKIKSSEELAALLAHEVAHIEYRHSLKSISRSLSGYLFVSAVFSDLNGITAVLVDNVNMLNRLSYSRNLERDADKKALETLATNGINPQGVVDLFNTLGSKKDIGSLKFLSTHPLTSERLRLAQEAVKPQRNLYKKQVALDQAWLRIRQQLNARQK